MTNDFNKATQKILREADANGGLTTRSLFDVLVAGHDEAVETAATLAAEVNEQRRVLREALEKVAIQLVTYNDKLDGKLDAHIEEDRKQLARIVSHLESEARRTEVSLDKFSQQVSGRAEAIDAAKKEVLTEAEIRYERKRLLGAEPRRATDPPDVDFSSKATEMWYSYRLVRWAAVITIVIGLGWLLPYWADSCASKNAEKANQTNEIQYVPRSVTPSPSATP